MTFVDIIIILIIALFITTIFFVVVRKKGSRGMFWLFFIVIFLAAWSARLWIVPFGPLILGIAWIPIFVVGLLFALVLYALARPSRNLKKDTIDKQVGAETDEDKKSVAYGAFFWVLIIILAMAVIIGYAIEHLP
ncbi:MAG: hypothetical protein H0X62_12100 [Bacteroidetes bacterium]|nr:hypothetical protein [Bacteroidota bacterium]